MPARRLTGNATLCGRGQCGKKKKKEVAEIPSEPVDSQKKKKKGIPLWSTFGREDATPVVENGSRKKKRENPSSLNTKYAVSTADPADIPRGEKRNETRQDPKNVRCRYKGGGKKRRAMMPVGRFQCWAKKVPHRRRKREGKDLEKTRNDEGGITTKEKKKGGWFCPHTTLPREKRKKACPI